VYPNEIQISPLLSSSLSTMDFGEGTFFQVPAEDAAVLLFFLRLIQLALFVCCNISLPLPFSVTPNNLEKNKSSVPSIFLCVEPHINCTNSFIYSLLMSPSDDIFFAHINNESSFKDFYLRTIVGALDTFCDNVPVLSEEGCIGSKHFSSNQRCTRHNRRLSIEDVISLKQKQASISFQSFVPSFDKKSSSFSEYSSLYVNPDEYSTSAVKSLFLLLTALVQSFPHLLLPLFISPSFDVYMFALLFLTPQAYMDEA
jgi:hypothetical protein